MTTQVPATIRDSKAVTAAGGTGSTEVKVFENEFDLAMMLPTAGQLKVTKQQNEILDAPVNPEDVEIRPDGLIYLPWMEYATRLKKAFGTGAWALVPHGLPRVQGNYILWGFSLVIQGHYCGYAIGEQEYHPGNRTMSWGDACEGAKSNALMRLCKGIGISLELWQPSFVREWKALNAESYKAPDKRTGETKTFWRRKKTAPTNSMEPKQPEKAVAKQDNKQTIDEGAPVPDRPTMIDVPIKMRSGPALIKWVKDNASNLLSISKGDAQALKNKWDKFVSEGKIDKELNLKDWVMKNATLPPNFPKSEEVPAQENTVTQETTPQAAQEAPVQEQFPTGTVEVVQEIPAEAEKVQEAFEKDPGPREAQEFDHLVRDAVKGNKGTSFESFDEFFREQWESKKDKYPDINSLKAQVVAKNVFRNAWQAYSMWMKAKEVK